MRYIECPQEYSGKEKSLFLAGGITGCVDWQLELLDLLKDTDLVILNPRRKNFDLSISNIEEEQIAWEFNHLNKADAVSFWFPKETLCPITLYELGKISMGNKKLFIGLDPSYARKNDVLTQTKLIRPDVKIIYSLRDLAEQIISWSGFQ
ncbi:Nucleoside 2-deoxyribosyltransferase like protein [uncultured archaeon]|nr:Nucleoside 2-deoxyribosyltransferase like protein [uncultured archaeon]